MFRKTAIFIMMTALVISTAFAGGRTTSYVMLKIESDGTGYDVNVSTDGRGDDKDIVITGSVLMSLLNRQGGLQKVLHESYALDTSAGVDSISLEQLRSKAADQSLVTQLMGSIGKNGQISVERVYQYETDPAGYPIADSAYDVVVEDGRIVLDMGWPGRLVLDLDERGRVIVSDDKGVFVPASLLSLHDEEGNDVIISSSDGSIFMDNSAGDRLAEVHGADVRPIGERFGHPFEWTVSVDRWLGDLMMNGVHHSYRQRLDSIILRSGEDGEDKLYVTVGDDGGIEYLLPDRSGAVDPQDYVLCSMDGVRLSFAIGEDGCVEIVPDDVCSMNILVSGIPYSLSSRGGETILAGENGEEFVFDTSGETPVLMREDGSSMPLPSDARIMLEDGTPVFISVSVDGTAMLVTDGGTPVFVSAKDVVMEGRGYHLSSIDGRTVLEAEDGSILVVEALDDGRVRMVDGTGAAYDAVPAMEDGYGRAVSFDTDESGKLLEIREPGRILSRTYSYSVIVDGDDISLVNESTGSVLTMESDENGKVYVRDEAGASLPASIMGFTGEDGQKLEMDVSDGGLLIRSAEGEVLADVDAIRVVTTAERKAAVPEGFSFTVDPLPDKALPTTFRMDGYLHVLTVDGHDMILTRQNGKVFRIEAAADGSIVLVDEEGNIRDADKAGLEGGNGDSVSFRTDDDGRIELLRSGQVSARSAVTVYIGGEPYDMYMTGGDIVLAGKEDSLLVSMDDNGELVVCDEAGQITSLDEYDIRDSQDDFVVLSLQDGVFVDDNVNAVADRRVWIGETGIERILHEVPGGFQLLDVDSNAVMVDFYIGDDGRLMCVDAYGMGGPASMVPMHDGNGNPYLLSNDDGRIVLSFKDAPTVSYVGKTWQLVSCGEDIVLDDGDEERVVISIDRKGRFVVTDDGTEAFLEEGAVSLADGTPISFSQERGAITVNGADGDELVRSDESSLYNAPKTLAIEGVTYEFRETGRALVLHDEGGESYRIFISDDNGIVMENPDGVLTSMEGVEVVDEFGRTCMFSVTDDGALAVMAADGEVYAVTSAPVTIVYDRAGNPVRFSSRDDGTVDVYNAFGQHYSLVPGEDGAYLADGAGGRIKVADGFFFDAGGADITAGVDENGDILLTDAAGRTLGLDTGLRDELLVYDDRGQQIRVYTDGRNVILVDEAGEASVLDENSVLYDIEGRAIDVSFGENGEAVFTDASGAQTDPVQGVAFLDSDGEATIVEEFSEDGAVIVCKDGTAFLDASGTVRFVSSDGEEILFTMEDVEGWLHDADGNRVDVFVDDQGLAFSTSHGRDIDMTPLLERDALPVAYEGRSQWLFTVLYGRNLTFWEKNWNWADFF